MSDDPYEPGWWPDGAPMLTTKPPSKRERAQSYCRGIDAAHMTMEFQREFRDVYSPSTMIGFTAVGPVATFIGFAIQNGWLAPGPRMLADPVEREPMKPSLFYRIFGRPRF